MTFWGHVFYEQNQCRGEPYVRPPDKNRYQTYVRE